MDNMAERVKSPEPPIPFIILVPDYVSGVDVTEYIGFQSRIDGHQAETAGYFRIVGDFLRAKQNLIFEEIQVRVDVADHFVADRQ